MTRLIPKYISEPLDIEFWALIGYFLNWDQVETFIRIYSNCLTTLVLEAKHYFLGFISANLGWNLFSLFGPSWAIFGVGIKLKKIIQIYSAICAIFGVGIKLRNFFGTY